MVLQLKPAVENGDSRGLFPALALMNHLQPMHFSSSGVPEAVCGTQRGGSEEVTKPRQMG